MCDSDSDLEESEGFFTPDKRRRGGNSRASPVSPVPSKGKGKTKTEGSKSESGPSEAVIATWRRGDDDLEPSTKMLALVGYLKEWDRTGDKTICYSQCRPYSPTRHRYHPFNSFSFYRDVCAWFDRDIVFSSWHSELKIRWENGSIWERCDFDHL